MVLHKYLRLFYIIPSKHTGYAFYVARIKLSFFVNVALDREREFEIDICKVNTFIFTLYGAFFDVRGDVRVWAFVKLYKFHCTVHYEDERHNYADDCAAQWGHFFASSEVEHWYWLLEKIKFVYDTLKGETTLLLILSV